MSSYTFFALLATLAYVPLLVTSFSIRPWQSRQKHLTWFLVVAILYGVSEVLRGTGTLPRYDTPVGALPIVLSLWAAVQFYYFVTSVFPPARRTWLLLAYASLAATVVLAILPQAGTDSSLSLWYYRGIILMTLPVMVLLLRSVYILWKRLGSIGSAILHRQVFSLLVSILVITSTTMAGVFLQGRGLPVGPAGHIVVAFLFSYALTDHKKVEIRPFIRCGVAWISLGSIGVTAYWVLFLASNALFEFEVNHGTVLLATFIAIIVAVMVYNLRYLLPALTQRTFRRLRPDYFRKLNDFTDRLDGIVSLRQQGNELLSLVREAIDCRKATLLLLDFNKTEFITGFAESGNEGSSLSGLRLGNHTPLIEFLRRQHKLVTMETLASIPDIRSAWKQEIDDIKSRDVGLLVPLLSRGSLNGILVIGKKKSGLYTFEDTMLLEYLTDRLALVVENGFFREQHRQYEQELSVMNRTSVIITSSLDVESIFDSLIDEIRRIVDISWAAVSLIDDRETSFLAVYADFRSTWKTDDRLPVEGTPAEWLSTHKEAVVEPDIQAESRFIADRHLLRQGFRSVAHIPLSTGDEIIGSLDLASRYPNAFNSRQTDILERIASQIASQIRNSRLYSEAVRIARTDELTGLYNRRAMDEMIAREVDHCSRYNGLFSLIILDIDSLKSINDNYGHLVGDEFLRQVGNTLRTAIRSTDRAFRCGGDEFAIILPRTTVDAAIEVAERIRRQLAANVLAMEMPTTASLGVAGWPASEPTVEALMAAADAALYRAKKQGGNQSCLAAEPVRIIR
jgi:diguanylate cyclase (GGDEF)-like protein